MDRRQRGLDGGDGVVELRDPAADLLAEGERRRILEVGAADLDDAGERARLAGEGVAQPGHGRQEVPHGAVGGGEVMFGGDDQPGMVDLKVTGSIHDRGPGELKGALGSIDTTIKDIQLGPVKLTADRLHFDDIDELEVVFDGFRPANAMVIVHRVTATNVSLQLAGKAGR